MTRREKLEAMLADDPHDQMLRYMLALELDKEGDNERSLTYLGRLMDDTIPYVPAFLMAGQQLTRLERVEDARSAFRRGIDAAKTQGNDHAHDELQRFLSELD